MVRALAAGAVLALAASTAGAAERIATQPREADLGAKKDVAPDAALGGTLQAKKPKAAEPGGPKLDFETFRKAVEVQVSEKRREEIASLRRLIDLGGGSATETPQWYFRLAELLWEESQYYFFEANRRDDQLIALGTRGDPREIDRLMGESARSSRSRRTATRTRRSRSTRRSSRSTRSTRASTRSSTSSPRASRSGTGTTPRR